MRRITLYKTLVVIVLVLLTTISASAEKKADSEYMRSARYVDICNSYGTWSIMIHQGYGGIFYFQTFRGYEVDKEYMWKNARVSVADKIVIKAEDNEGNDCKMTILPDGKKYSIWVEIRNKSGNLLNDFDIREIGAISFAISLYDYRKSKNVKSGFKLLKEWMIDNYL